MSKGSSKEDDIDVRIAKLRQKMDRLNGGRQYEKTWETMAELIDDECGEDIHRETAMLKQ
jgi:hypothetical protein